MRERPILFSAPMVRAILDGRKTQTRRIVKNPPEGAAAAGVVTSSTRASSDGEWWWLDAVDLMDAGVVGDPFRCPYGQPGDRLWVRETWGLATQQFDHESRDVVYRADTQRPEPDRWRPSIHMPRWASRITLEVTDVRVERLQAISEADAIAEGVNGPMCAELATKSPWANEVAPVAVHTYAALWSSINGRDSWDANPWVWVVGFRRVTP